MDEGPSRSPPSASIVDILLGASPGIGKRLGLPDDWAYNDDQGGRQLQPRSTSAPSGEGSPYKLPRGKNHLWNNGGLLYPLVLD